MKQLCLMTLCLATSTIPAISAVVSISSFNSPYTQNFNTLDYAGTEPSANLPAGWQIYEVGSAADGRYTYGNGSSSYNDTYSYGAAGSSERAFGVLRGGSVASVIGIAFKNDTGMTITTLAISYTGEQWRLGNANRSDFLNFEYSFKAASLGDGTVESGTWSAAGALNFESPNTTASVGPLNGNTSLNRRVISAELTGLAFESGQTMWLRWKDYPATGEDDGLAVDDFSLTAVPEPVNLALGVFGGAAAVTGIVTKILRRRKT